MSDPPPGRIGIPIPTARNNDWDDPTSGATGDITLPKTARSDKGWNHANRAVARSLPTSLALAARLNAAALRALR